MFALTLPDTLALAWFAFAWAGYAWITEWSRFARHTLSRAMDERRREWMRHMLDRDVRIIDTQIMASLQNGTAFFASTSLIALGGAFTLLNQSERLLDLFRDLPLGVHATRGEIELKGLILCGIYGYAFFKFGWAYRIFNYAAILLGSVPPAPIVDRAAGEAAARRAAEMQITAAQHFNRGLRALFFSLGFLGSFVHPTVFVGTTGWILVVMLMRQFGPQAKVVRAEAGDPV